MVFALRELTLQWEPENRDRCRKREALGVGRSKGLRREAACDLGEGGAWTEGRAPERKRS